MELLGELKKVAVSVSSLHLSDKTFETESERASERASDLEAAAAKTNSSSYRVDFSQTGNSTEIRSR